MSLRKPERSQVIFNTLQMEMTRILFLLILLGSATWSIRRFRPNRQTMERSYDVSNQNHYGFNRVRHFSVRGSRNVRPRRRRGRPALRRMLEDDTPMMSRQLGIEITDYGGSSRRKHRDFFQTGDLNSIREGNNIKKWKCSDFWMREHL